MRPRTVLFDAATTGRDTTCRRSLSKKGAMKMIFKNLFYYGLIRNAFGNPCRKSASPYLISRSDIPNQPLEVPVHRDRRIRARSL